ncbi:ribosome small subunit-dependent GTPase A [Oxalobacter paraformigenes]|uniref:Small ribosomal subunit biogenesis GTPase RsgA n=1 Tax=Oxalobacter paraformigenes TaxID=556268 RepID=C3X2G8_9BURK|nr:ribosome small subunit-dependent GTPase A [Oxalobacter paraformigenes]EEO27404.1 ribosome small subunit-dependent GTPase A [Oxalobacter paraformigenes]
MNDLQLYGWNEELFRRKQESAYKDFTHGRVMLTHKTCYEVISETGYYTCELTGNMMYGRDASEYPCTGDWVIFQSIDRDKGIILDVLPRVKTLYRLKNGAVSQQQAIASYIDKAFIVQSLDSRFNVRRIERFMLQLSGEDIQPLLVLTKTDLGFNTGEIEKAIIHLSHKIPVCYTSIESPESIDKLREFIRVGETVVFTGMSGAGKSTLINALCGQEVLRTGSISDSTGKGKHTSTRREMVLLPESGVVIDTPGVKLFGVTNNDTDTLSDILDISDYEGKCRFKDCRHVNEKGCAVIEAVENGEIDSGVYESYLKLRREAWHYAASVQEKRKKEKSLSKLVEEVKGRKLNRQVLS